MRRGLNGKWAVGAALLAAAPVQAQVLTPVGVAEANTAAALTRIQALNPKLNAVIAVDPTALDQARALDRQKKARGPLHGLPILVKDNVDVAGPLPTTAGSLALKDNVTGRDAPFVARLRAAGAVLIGKTNLSEWANIRADASISGWSAVGGQTRNPHALTRNTCGSSSGSGAAVAAQMVDAAIGTETDGSITCPAAVNGIVGIKPTVGLVSRTHVIPISHSQDTAGPMTRDIETAARLLTAMAGSDPADPATKDADARKTDYLAALKPGALKGARIGVARFATGWHAGVDERFEAALAVLKREGAVLVDITTGPDRRPIRDGEFLVLMTELKADLNAYLASTPANVKTRTLADLIAFNKANAGAEMGLFGQDQFEKAQATKGLTDPEYLKARETSLRLAGKEGIDKLLAEAKVEVIVAPTAAPAWFIDAVNADQSPGGGIGGLAAVSGYPHLTVPMGAVRGLPVGLSFIGPAWSEARLLALGYGFEQGTPGLKPIPQFVDKVEDSAEVQRLFAPAPR
ncbi:amidase [Sandarakinorhabdus rubra]|uniref:amidase n=1 Tax=Sandarakinorhabdus rubra TaxID=2672568 RepID=UPI0013D9FF84|nr:amidase [Sandarakinorhabdus rubra]